MKPRIYFKDTSLDMMSAESVINLLPSNETEMDLFVRMSINEILHHPDPEKVLKQLKWARKTIFQILDDKDIQDIEKRIVK